MSSDRIVKAVSTEGVSQIKKQLIERKKGDAGGVDHTHITEPHGNLLIKGQEKVIEGQNNNFIIMGRDRPGDGQDGYGGAGHTHASSIRLIAGLHGRDVKETNIKKDGDKVVEERLFLQPSPSKDAATIYMSQKTDIDSAFNISTGGRYGAPQGRSAILAKADCIRLVGRESLKLVTKTENKNSLKGPVRGKPGIELIAGNDTTNMQPLVKGKNLIEALDQTMEVVNQLSNIVEYSGVIGLDYYHFTKDFAKQTVSPKLRIVKKGDGSYVLDYGQGDKNARKNVYNQADLNQEIQKLKNKYSEDKLVSRHNMTN